MCIEAYIELKRIDDAIGDYLYCLSLCRATLAQSTELRQCLRRLRGAVRELMDDLVEWIIYLQRRLWL